MRTLRGRIVSVTRPAYVSAGPHSSEILDDGECSRCLRPYRVIRERDGARLVDCGCNRRWQIDEGTPIGIDEAAQGLSPLPSRAASSIRAGVRVRPRARSAQNNPAGTSPDDRKEG